MDVRVQEEVEAATAFVATPWSSMRRRERRAVVVGALSLLVMAVELVAGLRLNSLALISDGLHTSTHVGVMALAAGAYAYSRRHAQDTRFAFGPGKVGDLAAFASGTGLAVTALFIALESLQRLVRPEAVALKEAAGVAGLSLVMGLASAALLRDAHGVVHPHPETPHEHGRDLNLWAAYLHMLADVVTSVLAIAALLIGAALKWTWLDAAVGLVNAGVVAAFAVGLLRRAARDLLDMQPAEDPSVRSIREVLGTVRPQDLKLWKVGPGRLALVVGGPVEGRPGVLSQLEAIPGVAHVLVEPSRR